MLPLTFSYSHAPCALSGRYDPNVRDPCALSGSGGKRAETVKPHWLIIISRTSMSLGGFSAYCQSVLR